MGAADAGGHAFEAGIVMAPVAELLLAKVAHFVGHSRKKCGDMAILRFAHPDHGHTTLDSEIRIHVGIADHRKAQFIGVGRSPHTRRESAKTDATFRPSAKPVLGAEIL